MATDFKNSPPTAIAQADVDGLASALAAKEATANKNAASGYAPLDSGSKVPVANLPAASASAPGTQSAAHFSKVEALPSAAALVYTTGTAGAGGLLANRIVYDDASTGTLLYARANAVATAIKIRGVTTTAASAAATATIQDAGIHPVKGASDIVPAIGAELYLSSEAGGLVTTVLTGIMSPVLIGYCRSAAVDGSGNVSVKLAIDAARDHGRPWLVGTWEPVSDTAGPYDCAVTPEFWRNLEIRVFNFNANHESYSTGIEAHLRIDEANAKMYDGGSSILFGGLTYNAFAPNTLGPLAAAGQADGGAGAGSGASSGIGYLDCMTPLWAFRSVNATAQSGAGLILAATSSVGIIATNSTVAFKGGVARVEVWGKKA